MTHAKGVFIFAAMIATLWAAISFVTGFDADFRAAAIIAILCLGATHFLDYRSSEQLRQKFLWECGREAVWDRRDLESLPEVDS